MYLVGIARKLTLVYEFGSAQESFLHLISRLGRCLHENQSILTSELLTLLSSHHSPVFQVCLVAH